MDILISVVINCFQSFQNKKLIKTNQGQSRISCWEVPLERGRPSVKHPEPHGKTHAGAQADCALCVVPPAWCVHDTPGALQDDDLVSSSSSSGSPLTGSLFSLPSRAPHLSSSSSSSPQEVDSQGTTTKLICFLGPVSHTRCSFSQYCYRYI